MKKEDLFLVVYKNDRDSLRASSIECFPNRTIIPSLLESGHRVFQLDTSQEIFKAPVVLDFRQPEDS